MFGGTSEMIEPFMAAMEMIHTYSLVHDDLPAMDDDEYRRGRKTTHIQYGEAMGILAGDALLNYAFETAAKAFDLEPDQALRIGKALAVLAGKAGVYGMLGGQVADVEYTGKEIPADVLDFIYDKKTGALLEGSMQIGAILARASDEEVQTIGEIALSVGYAFQVRDDILDMISTTEELGKPVHSDEKNEKYTYASIHGIEKSEQYVAELTEKAVELLHSTGREGSFLEWLFGKLVERKK
jgi:geranylgeranyl diphosphate synthase type II